MPRLSIRLLGGFDATLDGQTLTGFRSDKVRALLAYLAVEAEGPQRREKLAGLLWPEYPESSARASLRRALSNLRRLISAQAAGPPYLDISRQALQFRRTSDVWVDVAAFCQLVEADLSAEGAIEGWEAAVALYRGDFLTGFSIPDSAPFEEWALIQRERLQRNLMETLDRLSAWYEKQGQFEQALAHAWRQVELDPWREAAQRHLMRSLACSGRRGAALNQYEVCRRLLAQELGVEPAPETTRLFEQIRDGELQVRAFPLQSLEHSVVNLPPFLAEEVRPTAEPPPFVARKRELARLEGFLAGALAGKGGICFVTGGAGRGKTALMWEFARRAMQAHPELLAATGSCNAYSGIGDPYLPFREMLSMLAGDVEGWWSAGNINREQAQRLWRALPLAVQSLLNHAPDLLDLFIPGTALLGRATAAAPGGAPWLERLRDRLSLQRADPTNPEQPYLFQQVTTWLRTLSMERPLLLMVDDLQWVDAASVSLLFHLSRHISQSPVLIIGSYRPHEVSMGYEGASHPLEPVLAEFKRQCGDVWLDLAHADELDGRAFVDAWLDMEPNRLDEAFRQELERRTGGHPLFTIELLRALRERGDLVRDDRGAWVAGSPLHWETLPARVEGVIEERMARLEPRLVEILSAASVEGETFTAQVVARACHSDDAAILWALSQELERRHGLVRERGETHVGGRYLSRYQFVHAVFHRYLYGHLASGVRRLLHREIGVALEGLYAGDTGEIAVQLVRHYAGDVTRERHYARIAGERAAARFANEEAVRYLSRALELTPEMDRGARCDLLLARERVYDVKGERVAQAGDLASLEALVAGEQAGAQAAQRKAHVALRRAHYGNVTSDYGSAIEAAQRAVDLAQANGDAHIEAQGRLEWGRALWRLGQHAAAESQLGVTSVLARQTGARQVEADNLRTLGAVAVDLGDYAIARVRYDEALAIYREIGDRRGESATLNNLGVAAHAQSELADARAFFLQAQRMLRQIGVREVEATVLLNLGRVSAAQGDREGAAFFLEQGLTICRELGDRHLEGLILSALSGVAMARGDLGAARDAAEQGVRVCREIGDRRSEGWARTNLGRAVQYLGNYAEATGHFEQARCAFLAAGDRRGEAWSLCHAGAVWRDRGQLARARRCLNQTLEICHEIGDPLGEALGLSNLGRTCADAGDYEQARLHHERALALLRQIGQRPSEAWCLANLGLLYCRMGNGMAACEASEQAVRMARESDDLTTQADALYTLGRALDPAGNDFPRLPCRDDARLAQAAAAYGEALALRQALHQPHLATEPMAGLAWVALARGDTTQALSRIQPILEHVANGTLDGTEEPLRVYLICYYVLRAAGDSRAGEVIKAAHERLQAHAAGVGDEALQRSLLENVTIHHRIIEEAGGQMPAPSR